MGISVDDIMNSASIATTNEKAVRHTAEPRQSPLVLSPIVYNHSYRPVVHGIDSVLSPYAETVPVAK